MTDKKQKRILELLDSFDSGAVQTEDFVQIMTALVEIIKNTKDQLSGVIFDTDSKTDRKIQSTLDKLDALNDKIDFSISDGQAFSQEEVKKAVKQLMSEVTRVESLIPTLPDLTYLEDKISSIVIPTIEQIENDLPKLGERIRDGLELLQGEERLDKSAIRGLDDYEETARLAREPKGSQFTAITGIKEIVAGDNISVDNSNLGYPVVSASGGVLTDEKVKYDASDPTAGYVADKVVAGTGISVAEGTGGSENKLVITNSAPDQVVSITDSGAATVTGTYPNFNIDVSGMSTGDVVGPASSVSDDIAVFDGTTGKLIKDGGAKIADLEVVANKSTSVTTDGASDTKYPSVKAVKDYADGLVVGLLDYRGAYDASVNTFPATGGSGTAGAILKGDMWVISVAGTIGGSAVQAGDSLIANTDTPGQTAGNWNTLNTNITYVPENSANKVTSISGSSTDVQYPSAKLVYDQLALKAGVGLSNLSSVAINTSLVSDTDNTDSLGTSAIAWSDLFLGNGSVINWSTAPSTPDVTLTHTANRLTLGGGSLTLGDDIISANDAELDIFGTTNAILHLHNTGAQGTTAGAASIVYALPSGEAMLSGNRLGAFVLGGSKTAANVLANSSAITSFTTENWSNTATGSNLVFEVTPNTTTTRQTALTLGQDKSATFAGTVALGTNSLTMTGSIGATGARVTKGWFTDLESTNAIAASITGSAATLTTPRAIYGNNFDGSAALTQVIASTYGGTGNGFTKFTGPATSEKTFTLPNSSATLLYSGGALGTPSSGTLTNCTFPTLNQDTTGTAAKTNALNSATTVVNVSSATAPSSGQVLTATSSTAATWQTPTTGGGITWTEVTGTTQSAAVNNGYIANNAGLVTITIPTTAAVGSIVRVSGSGAGGWKIAQNASESIKFGNQVTTTGTGGYLSSVNQYDAVELICIVADTTWSVISSQGNITVN